MRSWPTHQRLSHYPTHFWEAFFELRIDLFTENERTKRSESNPLRRAARPDHLAGAVSDSHNVGFGMKAVPVCSRRDIRFRGKTGKHMLPLSSSQFGPKPDIGWRYFSMTATQGRPIRLRQMHWPKTKCALGSG
jgi:hypothetical protein